MNRIALCAWIAALAVPALAPAHGDLTRYRNKNRLLLIFAPCRADFRWKQQNTMLAQSAADFKERDLIRFDFLENEGYGRQAIKTKALRMRYGVKSGQFRVLLIGKDGHIAASEPAPITLSRLTAQIDRMPMRRDEMKRQQKRREGRV